MITNEITNYTILEMIQMKRAHTRIKTSNKSCHVISCRLSGESTFFYNNKTYTVKKGDVLYIPYGASYYQECDAEEIIAFHLRIWGNSANELQIVTPENADEMCSLFRNAARIWQAKQTNYMYYCMSELYKIVAISNITLAPSIDTDYGIISPSIDYLKSHLYDTDLSLDMVYRQSNISQTSFIKYFHRFFECTPIKYINQMRIEKAKMLLISNLYTREEVASLCGYENVKHFYVMFKKITGKTTGEYIKSGETESVDIAVL